MANKTTIYEIINNGDALRVYDGLAVIRPQKVNEEDYLIGIQELCSKFNGRYATNNSTVAFVSEGEMYVAPYTRSLIIALIKAGFLRENFYVPFSNGDLPQYEWNQWESLRDSAHQSYEDDLITEYEKYCDEHCIGTISEKTLENCFEIPEEGIKVKYQHFEDIYYPFMNHGFFQNECNKYLGKYCFNNGRVVFIYRNGKTYVTKGYKIVEELKAAGFSRTDLFVPFSNGEKICNYVLREKWESIKK